MDSTRRTARRLLLGLFVPTAPSLAWFISFGALALQLFAAIPANSSSQPRNSQPSLPDRSVLAPGDTSSRGKPANCTDLRTGTPFEVRAQRILGSAMLDSAWVPDSTRDCTGSPHGLARHAVSDGNGGIFVAWTASRRSEPDVLVQRLTSGGSVAEGWSIDATSVADFAGAREYPSLCSDGAGGVFVAWQEHRGAQTSAIYVTRLTGAGTLTQEWPAGGLRVSESGSEQAHPQIMSDGTGGAVLVWLERSGRRLGVRAQRVSASGTRDGAWPAEGAELVVGAPEFQVTLLRTLRLANDELLLVWREESLEAARLLAATVNVSQPPLHALESPRLLATGTMVGPPTMLADGAGALIGWSERGAGNESVRLVRLIAGAAVAPGWPANGAALCAGPVGFDAPAILADGDGGATVAWVDRRLDDDGDIFAQRVAAAGSRHASWPEQGFAVCVASGEQFAPALAPDGNGGAIVTWVDTANQPAGGSLLLAGQSVIRPQLIETSIDPGRVRFTWSVDRKTPATYRAYRIEEGGELRELATLIPDGRGQIAMEDAQAPEGREVGYSLSVSIGEEERFLTPIRVQVPVTPLELALQRAWSPPGSDVIRIEFALPRGPAPRLELIDVAGRRVASRTLAEYLPGQRSAEIRPASGTRTGVYFVRLTQGSRTLSRKVVLVR